MGLLIHDLSKDFHKVAEEVYEKHFEVDKRLESEYSDYHKQKMYEDTLHNLSFLEVAIRLEEKAIFKNYIDWLIQLMFNLMDDVSTKKIKEQMTTHFKLIEESLKNHLDAKMYSLVQDYIKTAIEQIRTASSEEKSSADKHSPYSIHCKNYITLLLNRNVSSAVDYIKGLPKMSLSLMEVYVDVLQPVMYEIGNMWYRGEISADQEHYMTSITQTVLSQFYDIIFSTEKNGLTLIAFSVGKELHEMGARMISDLFEYEGWNSIYLGSAITKETILKNIKKYQPDLVVLSVTMPQHLVECKRIVDALNEKHAHIKIAVGGQAFNSTDELWNKWDISIYAKDARGLIKWANQTF